MKDKEKKTRKTRRKRCNSCDRLYPKEDVIYCVDPYEQDINGVVIWKNLCSHCYNDKCTDL